MIPPVARREPEGPHDDAEYPMPRPVLPIDVATGTWPSRFRTVNPDIDPKSIPHQEPTRS
jgi:hypothetical protein